MSRKLPSQMMSAHLPPTASSRRCVLFGPKYGKLLGKIRQIACRHWTALLAMDELKDDRCDPS